MGVQIKSINICRKVRLSFSAYKFGPRIGRFEQNQPGSLSFDH